MTSQEGRSLSEGTVGWRSSPITSEGASSSGEASQAGQPAPAADAHTRPEPDPPEREGERAGEQHVFPPIGTEGNAPERRQIATGGVRLQTPLPGRTVPGRRLLPSVSRTPRRPHPLPSRRPRPGCRSRRTHNGLAAQPPWSDPQAPSVRGGSRRMGSHGVGRRRWVGARGNVCRPPAHDRHVAVHRCSGGWLPPLGWRALSLTLRRSARG